MASNPRRRAYSPAACEQPGSKVDEKSDYRTEQDDVSMKTTRTTSMKYSLTHPDGSELMEKGRAVVKAGLPDMIPLDGINVSADVKRHMVPSAVPTIDEQQPDSFTILLCCRPKHSPLEGLACRLEESVCLYRILLPGHLRQSPNAAAER